MKPLTTVLIDTYNHERYIEQALLSVLDQGLSPAELEIVVVDDGSTDKTPDITQRFAPRVKHIRKQNGGQASALNAGFAESHGEIIATLDGDDWWAKGKLQAVLDVLEKHPDASAVSHGYFEFHEDTGEADAQVPSIAGMVSVKDPQAIRLAHFAWPFLPMGALTVRKKVLDWIMPIPEEMVFMADSPIQAASMLMGTFMLREPLFYYRHHSQNLHAVDPKNALKLRRRIDMAKLVYERLHRMLLERGVPSWQASGLVYPNWIAAKRRGLSTFGGSRLETFRTEIQAFQHDFQQPSASYRLFKYAVVGAATLLLPPQRFYRLRDSYSSAGLGRFRNRLFRSSP